MVVNCNSQYQTVITAVRHHTYCIWREDLETVQNPYALCRTYAHKNSVVIHLLIRVNRVRLSIRVRFNIRVVIRLSIIMHNIYIIYFA